MHGLERLLSASDKKSTFEMNLSVDLAILRDYGTILIHI